MLVTCFILWRHDPTPENPSNFQQKRGISHKHVILSPKKTPHGFHRVYIATPYGAFFYRDFSQEKRRQEEEEVARVQGRQSQGMQLHKEIPPRVPWSDTRPWLFFCGWGAGSPQNQIIYFKRQNCKTSFFNQTSMKTSIHPIWCTKLP